MSPNILAIIGIVVLVIVFMLRMPVAFAMAAVGLVGFGLAASWSTAMDIVAKDIWATFSSYTLSVAPMFILMGTIAFHAGIGSRLFNAAHKWTGRLPGGLGIATVMACAGFGAMCGSTVAAAAAMGKVALPEMKRYRYDDALRTGCVATAGTLAIMIPPSTTLIVYGMMTQESIGKLFMAGILPGIMLAVLFSLVIGVWVWWKPQAAPMSEAYTFREKLKSLSGVIEMLLLFALVMGGLFVGWFTPTEAGGIGAAGALVISVARRAITPRALWAALAEATHISAMVFMILAGATIFGHFMAITRAPFALAEWASGLQVPSIVIMIFVVCMYLVGGCFMDSLPLLTLTIPILYPLVVGLGYDPIWFGIICVLCTEIGVITPPVGINVFVIKGVAPEVPLQTIFKGILPFVIALLVAVVLLMLIPEIALLLPRLASG